MTKIKNSKKGLAKKAVSISLTAAMLATSGVPAFAADFSDGGASAFTAEAPVAAAVEVPETTTDVPVGQLVNDKWDVTFPDGIESTIGWKDAGSVKVQVAPVNTTATSGAALVYVWKDANTGLSVSEEETPDWTETPSNSAIYVADIDYPTGENTAGNSYILCIYDPTVEGTGQFAFNSPAVAVGAVDINEYFVLAASDKDQAYTGSEIDKTVTVKTKDTAATNVTSQFEVDYTGSLINVGTVNVTAKAIDTKLYKGSLTDTITVTADVLSNKYLTASLTNKTVAYTGANITTLDKSSAALAGAVINGNTVDITGVEITEVAPKNTIKNVEDHSTATVKANVAADATTTNFSAPDKDVAVTTKDEVTVVARDLKTVTATIPAQAIKSAGWTAADLAPLMEYTDADGNALTLADDVDVTFTGDIKTSGTFTLTIVPKSGNKNVTGTTTANLSVYSLNIADATFDVAWNSLGAEEYTGAAVEKVATELPAITYNDGKSGTRTLELTKDYSISYKNNINAGTATVVITGLRSFEGSEATKTFTINKATITTATDVTADTVIYNKDAAQESDYAKAMNVVVKAYNNADPKKEFTLKEGTDYTLAYVYNTSNAVGQKVKATITLADPTNYVISGNAYVEADISNPIIKDADIKMTKTSYEYTGAVITPEFTVVVDGKTLEKDTDYKVKSITQSAAIGTATLTIEGIGNYAGTAKATFEVTAVSADKLTVTVASSYAPVYDGTAKQPKLTTDTTAQVDDKKVTVTLDGNDVTDQFTISSYGENINAGEAAGSFVVTPVKDNKNFAAGTSKTVTFDIAQAELTGTITIYNANKIKVSSLPDQEYDGTAKTFDDYTFVFTPSVTGDKKVTDNDYEFAFYNNVLGDSSNEAQLAVIAKGNYKAADTNDITDESVTPFATIKNVAAKETFTLAPNPKMYFTYKDVTVSDATYAGANVVAQPTIVVRDNGKVLVEGTDYTLNVQKPEAGATPSATPYTFTVTGIGAYRDVVQAGSATVNTSDVEKNYVTGTWVITKKDVADLDITVSLDSKGNAVATIMNGNLKIDSKDFDVTLSDDKKNVTVAAKDGDQYYFGSQKVELSAEDVVGTPVISAVTLNRNHAKVVLNGDSEGATGYDYVVSTSSDPTDAASRVGISKNKTTTTSGWFYYLEQGTYYAYCHAYKMVDGKKVFSEWSNVYAFNVKASTPATPVIETVKVTKNADGTRNVTFTVTTGANTEGYDLYVGSADAKATPAGDLTVTKTYTKKNQTKSTVTIKNIPNTTKLYASAQAYNYSDGGTTKVLSHWAHRRTVNVAK